MMDHLHDNTLAVLKARYFLKDAQGKVIEDARGMCTRVAERVAREEDVVFRASRQEQYFDMQFQQKFLANSPVYFSYGTPYEMGSACFILPVGDSIDEIYSSVRNGALIEKLGGGVGMDFSQIRPGGSFTSRGNRASGPLSFMNGFDTMTTTIEQGGVRRGAMMATLSVDHPDILRFIDCKTETPPERAALLSSKYGLSPEDSAGILQDLNWKAPYRNFNITVKLTDAFMDAVKLGEAYELKDPRTGKVWEGEVFDPRHPDAGPFRYTHMPAKEVFARLVESAWKAGEPGIGFIDRINRENPIASVGLIRNSNPCGELWLPPYSSCNLGSINVSKFYVPCDVDSGFWEDRIHWEELENTVRSAVRFLDRVISINQYPVPEISQLAVATRPIGLGIMGFADLLLQLKVRYGSPESVAIATKLMLFINYTAWVTSVKLAHELGAFPDYQANHGFFDKKIPRLDQDFEKAFGLEFMNKYHFVPNRMTHEFSFCGVRNCQVTTLAPTGTISLIAECSSGIEPIFAYELCRTDNVSTRDYVHPFKQEWERVHPGEELPSWVVDANQVSPAEHVAMQAAFQKYCDNAISKTVNLPAEATIGDVRDVFLLAHSQGLKSITVYRDGCREGVLRRKTSKPTVSVYPGPVQGQGVPGPAVLETDGRPVFATVQTSGDPNFIKRPDFLPGGTWKLKTSNGTIYTTVSYDQEEARITEVFVRENSGNEAWELVGRLLSLLLRSRVEPDRILKQLYRTRGQSTIVLNGQIFSSIAQALASTLESAEKHFASPTLPFPREEPGEENLTAELEEETEVPKAQGTACPMCARYTFVPSGGCKTCLNCGYSTCGGTSK